jgi:site-specific recombinase XerD
MDTNVIGNWIRRFLMEYMVGECNFSPNTQASYRDTFVLLLPFVARRWKKPIEELFLDDVDADTVRSFLQYLEQERDCQISTRNQRLAAIRSLAHFIAERSPEHISWSTKVCSVPFKKGFNKVMTYLEKDEMDALLESPNRETSQGRRDYALLLFLYNTGARADEITRIRVCDLNFDGIPSVRIIGKGNRERYCPLWSTTVLTLRCFVDGRDPNAFVFLNRRKQPTTRFGVYFLVERCVAKAAQKAPSLCSKKASPHSIRHTTAVHLLRAGVDINTIRAWLGHVCLDTTHVYAEVDLEMKAKALAHCKITGSHQNKDWNKKPNLMEFLKNL